MVEPEPDSKKHPTSNTQWGIAGDCLFTITVNQFAKVLFGGSFGV